MDSEYQINKIIAEASELPDERLAEQALRSTSDAVFAMSQTQRIGYARVGESLYELVEKRAIESGNYTHLNRLRNEITQLFEG